MGATTTYALPYPELDDPDNVPTDMRALAQAVEAMPPLGYFTKAGSTVQTANNLTATGNVSAGGNVSATGDVFGNDVTASGFVEAALSIGTGAGTRRIMLNAADGGIYFGGDAVLVRASAGRLHVGNELELGGALVVDLANTAAPVLFGSAGDVRLRRVSGGELTLAAGTDDVPVTLSLGHPGATTVRYLGQVPGLPDVAGGRVISYAMWGLGVDNTTPDWGLDVNGMVHATAFPVSSDERLKRVLEPLAGAVAKLRRIRTVAFEWDPGHGTQRAYPAGRHVGVIAQDVRDVYPELVGEWAVTEPAAPAQLEPPAPTGDTRLTVDYGRLIAPVIEAIRELDDRLAALEAPA